MEKKEVGVTDLVLLSELSEAALVKNLIERFKADTIYTYIGDVVIALNPYKKIDIYSPNDIQNYKNRYFYERNPHLFALADDAYRSMISNRDNQCIVISGESGAGKTESSKIVMNFISAVAPNATGSKDATQKDKIKDKLLESNPVLEAFGNAKTLRNDNSSRFGKYMEIQFSFGGAPIGGKVTQYLLEKSRVISRAEGERCFHIFYQLLKGVTEEELKLLCLSRDASTFAYLNSSKCFDVDTINDAIDYKHVIHALNTLGVSSDVQVNMKQVLASILLIGNIVFKEAASQKVGETVVEVSNASSTITQISKLLQIDPNVLTKSLTSRTIETKQDGKTTVILDLSKAQYARDALAKSLYSKLFSWLVDQINLHIHYDGKEEFLQIGLLDIYGFEVFVKNSFEQYCINYCNEKLQQLFIELTLKSEQEEYEKEGIAWEKIDYFNNVVICSLIDDKLGMIGVMDELCNLGMDSTTDINLLEKFNKNFSKHDHFQSYESTRDKSIPNDSFRIKHFAGDVTYCVDGFLDKNRDQLFRDLVSAVCSSSNPLVQDLFPKSLTNVDDKKRPKTAGTQFKESVAALMKSLLACKPHYVRCIKPNGTKKPNVIEEDLVIHQVRYLGLLENVRVRRAGFCNRQDYPRFFRRYKPLSKVTFPKLYKGSDIEGAKEIVKATGIDEKNEIRYGKTKIFIRNPASLFAFEKKREQLLPQVAVMIQKNWRRFVCMKKYKKMVAALRIQTIFRGFRERKRFRLRRAATKIQWKFRNWQAKRWLFDVKKAYEKVKDQPYYAKNIVWPPHKRTSERAAALIKSMFRRWRAKATLTPVRSGKLPEAMVRQKIRTCDIFKGKRMYDIAVPFKGNYLAGDPLFDRSVSVIQSKDGSSKIIFSIMVTKLNRKLVAMPRALVITDKSIFMCDPKKMLPKPNKETPLSDVVGIRVSKFGDQTVVIQTKAPRLDYILDFMPGIHDKKEHISEFYMLLLDFLAAKNQKLTLEFCDTITFNNRRPNPDVTLSFGEKLSTLPSTPSAFRKENNNSVVLIPNAPVKN